MKKIVRYKTRIFLIILIASISCGYLLSTYHIEKPLTNLNEEENDNFDNFVPEISVPNWTTATKVITSGSQVDPPFDADNLKSDDGNVDDTMFSPGYKSDDTISYVNYGVTFSTHPWGTTDGGIGVWTNAYRYYDEIYLYLESFNTVGWISMQWGNFGNIPGGTHQYVRQIRIPYRVWADSFAGILDQSLYLGIRAYDDLGNFQAHTIAPIPGHRVVYASTFTFSSGVVFDRVKAGGYVQRLEVYMYANEEILTFTWINVDYAFIIYDYEMADLDLYYVLDFGGLGLTTISQFELNIGVDQCIDQTNIYLYNYVNSSWVTLSTTLTTAGLYIIDIISFADQYFSQSNKMSIAFTRYNYWDGNPYTQYHLKIDFIRIEIPPPDPPPVVYVNQEILHIILTWDPSPTYGVPVTQYNIYRGTVKNGTKTLLGTSSTTKYNDSAVVVGVRYYYVISASSISGESDNSTEVSGQAYDQPAVEWLTPIENKSVVFPLGDPVIFHFSYDPVEVDDVELVIKKGLLSVNFGSVWNETSVDITAGYIDGYVNATLIGYNQTKIVATASRFFTFVRITYEDRRTLNSSREIVGKQLYLILHDPSGDNSYSSFTEDTTLSLGVGSEISVSTGTSLTLGYFYEEEYSGMEFGASTLFSSKQTLEFGFDFRYEISDSTSLTSMQVTDDPDYIGPGLGDRYWGESWIYKWVLNATRRGYSNGTLRYEDPKLYYGIIRGAETYISHELAPHNWQIQNAVYNDSIPVTFVQPFAESGGAPYTYEHAVTSTQTRTMSLQFDLGFEFRTAFGIGESLCTMELSIKSYVETGLAHTYKVAYNIEDDDPTDFIVQGIGIDQRFGTFIFNTSSFFCETSKPYEHGTYDYVPPEIDFPIIDLDTNDDGYAPASDDTPYVEVEIYEDGGVQNAVIWYSIDNGTTWQHIYLTEYPAEPGKWYATLPAQPYNTTVLWYVEVSDNQGNFNSRKDSFGNPFEYKVIKKIEDTEEIPPGIQGYSGIIVTCSIFGTIIIFYKKYHRKLKNKT